jgi:hypothetical protein
MAALKVNDVTMKMKWLKRFDVADNAWHLGENGNVWMINNVHL